MGCPTKVHQAEMQIGMPHESITAQLLALLAPAALEAASAWSFAPIAWGTSKTFSKFARSCRAIFAASLS